ncbi:MAG TPA: phosphoribosylglycinamide synthetase C domain-containing protein, partial [Ferruginibacter sp.]|nr:phosphoribosylglycinamide synthetase C domain-containing protein [Ferruginibacter sp.]
GYPGQYEKGRVVEGLETKPLPGSLVFHAGTKIENGEIITNGGRILAITSFGENITEASEQSNYMLQQLFFEDMYYRTDIGYEFKESNVEE